MQLPSPSREQVEGQGGATKDDGFKYISEYILNVIKSKRVK
jgi:hypothetical protein